MTLEELKKAERAAYNHWMYFEAAERGYDSATASVAQEEWHKACRAVREAGALTEDGSIPGLVRQIKNLSERL